MFKKLFAAVAIVCALVALSACGGGSTQKAVSLSANHVVTLDGKWANDSSDPLKFNAVIKNNTITIDMTAEDSTGLYWEGTFPAKTKTIKDGLKIGSAANREALNDSLYGSSDKTKVFEYRRNELSFTMKMMGVTRIVHLVKK